MKNQRGFTLIELMLVVLILGVIASIAYPSYEDYRIRTYRTAAQQYMLELASAQQQYLMDNRSYTSTIASLGVNAPDSISGLYSVTIAVTTAPPGFTITATASGSQESDGNLTLTHLGVKSPADKW